MIIVVPGATVVTTPEELMVATPVLLLLQVPAPPAVASARVIEDPMQTDVGPVIVPGAVHSTVITTLPFALGLPPGVLTTFVRCGGVAPVMGKDDPPQPPPDPAPPPPYQPPPPPPP